MERLDSAAFLAGGAGDAGALQATAAIAQACGGTGLALFSAPDPAQSLVWAGDGLFVGPPAAAIADMRAAQARAGERLREEMRARAAEFGLSEEALHFAVVTGEPATALPARAAMADLVVLSHAERAYSGGLHEAFIAALMKSRLAALSVPEAGWRPGGAAALAWDGGRQAFLAMRTALPLLRLARTVTILALGWIPGPAAESARSEGAESEAPFADPECARAWLSARRIAARIEILPAAPHRGAALLAGAKAAGADLYVAGAFGHSWLGESLFGGATREILAQSPTLALMLHH